MGQVLADMRKWVDARVLEEHAASLRGSKP